MKIIERRLASVECPQTVDCSTNSKRDYRVFIFMYCAAVDREQTEQITHFLGLTRSDQS